MTKKFHRVEYPKHVPEAFRGLYAASTALHNGALGKEFLELIFLRVSQINGCAFCLDMHASALRKAGVESRKIDTVAGWRDSRFFDAREGAALAWAEQLTTLPTGAPADATYEALKEHFDEHGIAELTMAVATINAWNRLGVGMQPILP
ncbi:carboxymuconolactone decarboxylase family protein [Pseudoxanthomonas sp. PXM03]|jgi:AhpD family alkylhydroperoxidase|uniref:carboxymuconolactone decarboxylase family protein n=1 Tax=Pseudoxanthomonas sp. PXM03 TaxID=2769284 RepID=UPI001784B238|nr:carboxymuconolactone decarboxylase family protein [Pseudoxanthomonas sp. PXM03]MBD9436204.1 carboxymuconolactone decarboxylase family protein [Pseudoxanthomonas sp. PXM03]